MEQLNELALFSGAGGGILGGKLLGWRTVCAVEWEPYPASVLCARQNDGLLPPFPIWDDVQTFDGRPWKGIVDVVSGGFPCQDISAAGGGAGITGTRSGMWTHMARIISQVRPKYAFVENSSMLTVRGLGTVLGDLSEIGYDCKWLVMGAADVGANHQRDRIWIVAKWHGQFSHAQHNRIRWWEQQQKSLKKAYGKMANTSDQGLWSCGRGDGGQSDRENRTRCDNQIGSRADVEFAQIGKPQDLEKEISDTTSLRQQGQGQHEQLINSETNSYWQANIIEPIGRSEFWATEPNVGRVAHGVAARVDRLKAIGNGQVPLCAATAWETLTREYCHQ